MRGFIGVHAHVQSACCGCSVLSVRAALELMRGSTSQNKCCKESVTRRWRIACNSVTCTHGALALSWPLLCQSPKKQFKPLTSVPITFAFVANNCTMPRVHRDANVTATPDTVVTSLGAHGKPKPTFSPQLEDFCNFRSTSKNTFPTVASRWSLWLSCLWLVP